MTTSNGVTFAEVEADLVPASPPTIPVEGASSPLRWLLSQPDSRERYRGKFVAISMTAPEHEVIAVADDLESLLDQIEDLSAVYIHQMP